MIWAGTQLTLCPGMDATACLVSGRAEDTGRRDPAALLPCRVREDLLPRVNL